MATPTRREAAMILWQSPRGTWCELAPMSDGLLEIELQGTIVSVHSRNCSFVNGDEENVLAEYELCLPLDRCQIDWSKVERTEETEVERSQYFTQ